MKKKIVIILMLCLLMVPVVPVQNVEAKTSKVIYLTFDDGPSKYTPQVLKILKKYKVHATFFVTGQNKKYFKYIKKAYDAGNAIGLHSYSHKYSIYKSKKAYYKDLKKIQKLVKKYTGEESYIIRFPGGSSNTVSRHYKHGIMKTLTKDVRKKGYQYFDWNVESGDGNSYVSKSKFISKCKSKKKKIILLMHDANGKKTTVQGLASVIKYYKKKGYKFKTLSTNSYTYHHHVNN